jgi:hypothetical protein
MCIYIFMNMYIRMYLSNTFIAVSIPDYDTGSTILQSFKLAKTIAFAKVMIKYNSSVLRFSIALDLLIRSKMILVRLFIVTN